MRALSLFSGIGGLDIAASWAGIETAAFCEIEPFCQAVLRKHWPDVPIFGDIYSLHGENVGGVGSVDIIHGGAPCQPFSVAGKGMGERDERHLWPEMHRLVDELRPRWVVFENVPGIINRGIDLVLSDMEDSGYATWLFAYDAALFGAEHKRERVFAISHKRTLYPNEYQPCEWDDDEIICPECGVEFGASECWHDGVSSWLDESDRVSTAHFAKLGVEGLWPKGEPFPRSLAKTLLPLCSCDGKWEVEPDVCRAIHGVPRRVDRLRALGNAVVPQQAYPIFRAIAEMEAMM